MRLRILPVGVLSKKLIGDAMIFLRNLKCSTRPARMLPRRSKKLPTKRSEPEIFNRSHNWKKKLNFLNAGLFYDLFCHLLIYIFLN